VSWPWAPGVGASVGPSSRGARPWCPPISATPAARSLVPAGSEVQKEDLRCSRARTLSAGLYD
jgi:hypothetical protein